jgi:3-dehydroquinate dehydratase-2
MPKPLYVLNGPNLNLLGAREPELYGRTTLADIKKICIAAAKPFDLTVDFRQTQREGELVEWIQEAREKGSAIIINAAAYSHTSVAIYDALKMADLPIIEVHLSNIFAREAFRHHSYVSAAANGVICGLKADGYRLAVEAAASLAGQRGSKKK